MKGDPDNIIVPDGDYPLKDGPSRKKAKAVPVKKIAATNPRGADRNQRKSFDRVDNEGYIIKAPQDRANSPKRRSTTARHAKPGEPVYGDYPATPTGPAIGGKHGKPWNGRD
jgi:hypothetical protein